jgi:monoamine oxidase
VALTTSAYGIFFDTTPPGTRLGVISGFMNGSAAQQWADASHDDRRAQVLADIARALGSQALSPSDFVENNWNREPWSQGGYSCIPSTGALTSLNATLDAPEGRIHWAGSDISPEWSGYVEGALRSGERVANEILSSPR